MRLAKILLPLMDSASAEAMSQVAFALARRFGAEVEGLHASLSPRDQFMIQDEAGAFIQLEAMIEEAEERARKARNSAKKRFSELAAAHSDVSSHFMAVEGNVSTIVGQRGRVADLTVIGSIDAEQDDTDWGIEVREGAIFQTGRPVIVAPPGAATAGLGDTVVIAWKDGVEAARAIGAARPFLSEAKRVHIVTAGADAASKQSLDDVETYVSSYSNSVSTAEIGAGKRNVAELLMEEAMSHEGTLLVMGAYSQWRWKEWAFGGVTDYMLRKTRLPVLMAH